MILRYASDVETIEVSLKQFVGADGQNHPARNMVMMFPKRAGMQVRMGM